MSNQLNYFHTGSPVIERTVETFVEHVAVGGENRRVEFEKTIVWLLESSTQILFRHGGRVLKEGGTYNDWYGVLKSINGAMEDAAVSAAAYDVSTQSSLEIVLVSKVMHTPAFEPPDAVAENASRADNYRKRYAYVPIGWRQERMEDGEMRWPTLEPKVLVSEEVWSTRRTDRENDAIVSAFVNNWKDGAPKA
jgi:hypothetical protein